MKSTLLPFVTMMTLLFLLPTGCRKDDAAIQLDEAEAQLMRDFLSDDYFASASEYYNPPPADPSAQTTTESRTKTSMTAALKDYFSKNPDQVKKINQKYGYPVWEHALNADVDDGEFYQLPIAKTNKNKIESILFAYKKSGNEKLGFLMVDRKDLSKIKKSKKAKKNSSGKYEEMTLELAVTSTALFEYNMFQSIDCELANLLKDTNLKTEMTESRSCYYVISYSVYGTHYVAPDGTEVFVYHWQYFGYPICAYPVACFPDCTGNVGGGTTGNGGGGSTDPMEFNDLSCDIGCNCQYNLSTHELASIAITKCNMFGFNCNTTSNKAFLKVKTNCCRTGMWTGVMFAQPNGFGSWEHSDYGHIESVKRYLGNCVWEVDIDVWGTFKFTDSNSATGSVSVGGFSAGYTQDGYITNTSYSGMKTVNLY